ncbi:hypothetical protein LMH87_001513 [Akanthomyces muscarius]|uniref:Uncharacterized protein n=1 Tax=Akanthomyces muscarius TaxID=2231603 RepID=A0A9W8Q6G8_AKAMU|nr:hypothetical protein LMH87_001513 [Akanthomyces muscarius]KAJ4146960.1 hypothetical protein LMH87_001513 [Akanthomyces muscarius]
MQPLPRVAPCRVMISFGPTEYRKDTLLFSRRSADANREQCVMIHTEFLKLMRLQHDCCDSTGEAGA